MARAGGGGGVGLDKADGGDGGSAPHISAGQLLPHGIRTIESVNFYTFHFNIPNQPNGTGSIVFDCRRTFEELKAAIAKVCGRRCGGRALVRGRYTPGG